MSYFVKVEKGITARCVIAQADFFNTFIDQSPGEWIESPISIGIGLSYADGIFTEQKPFDSWILNDSGIWEAPVAIPTPIYENNMVTNPHTWNEETTTWDEVVDPTE